MTTVLNAIIYVLGMAITYSLLGVIAAITGGLLGSALQNPLVIIFVALVLIVLALSMFGREEIRVPQSLAAVGGKNRAGSANARHRIKIGPPGVNCAGPAVRFKKFNVGRSRLAALNKEEKQR